MARENLDVLVIVFVNHAYRILKIEPGAATGAGNPRDPAADQHAEPRRCRDGLPVRLFRKPWRRRREGFDMRRVQTTRWAGRLRRAGRAA